VITFCRSEPNFGHYSR